MWLMWLLCSKKPPDAELVALEAEQRRCAKEVGQHFVSTAAVASDASWREVTDLFAGTIFSLLQNVEWKIC